MDWKDEPLIRALPGSLVEEVTGRPVGERCGRYGRSRFAACVAVAGGAG